MAHLLTKSAAAIVAFCMFTALWAQTLSPAAA